MDSGILRDFIIVITGSLILVLLVLFCILGFQTYRHIKSLIKSIKDSIQTSKEMSLDAKETIKSVKTLINMLKQKPSKNENQMSDSPTNHSSGLSDYPK